MSTSLESIFETNTKAEEDGVWVTLTADHEFLIRAFSAKAAVDLRDKLTRPHQGLLRAGGKIPDEVNDDINLKVLAGAIIADWRLTDRTEAVAATEDEPAVEATAVSVPYSADEAYKRMKKLPRFANWVAQQALDAQNYKDALAADSAKN